MNVERFQPDQGPPPVVLEPEQAARAADLRYTSDDGPGIRRVSNGRGFLYLDARGRRIEDGDALQRIRSLAIPPAWTDVWICPSPRGHLQATGRDARGRKQYRYHPRWREVREKGKFEKMIAFGQALPAIRAGVRRDLRRRTLAREKVLATVVRLLDLTLARVGNERYRRSNRSHGLTTLRKRHVAIRGSRVHLRYRGKGGKLREITAADRQAADVVRKLQELAGQELFQYVNGDGEPRPIDSGDVNAYLKDLGGAEFSAKDFRTWAGTLAVARALREAGLAESQRAATRCIKQAIGEAAELLGNTPTICRKAYVHPAVLDAFRAGRLMPCGEPPADREGALLSTEERELLAFLQALGGEENADVQPFRAPAPQRNRAS